MGKPQEQKDLINRMIDTLDKVKEALVKMRDEDLSMTEVIKDSGLDYATFRRVVFDSRWDAQNSNFILHEKREDFKKKFSTEIPTLHWTEDLFCTVTAIRRNPESVAKMPKDVRETVEKAVSTLSKREQEVVLGIYKENMSKAEIAKSLELTLERVRQIESNALRKLRNPHRLSYLVYGNDFYMDQKELHEHFAEDYAIFERNEEINLLDKIIRERKEFLKRTNPTNYKQMLKNMNIVELDLGVRAYNCLTRRGIGTISELCSLTHEELRNIRNMGQKTYEEVLDIMEKHGLHLSDDE